MGICNLPININLEIQNMWQPHANYLLIQAYLMFCSHFLLKLT